MKGAQSSRSAYVDSLAATGSGYCRTQRGPQSADQQLDKRRAEVRGQQGSQVTPQLRAPQRSRRKSRSLRP